VNVGITELTKNRKTTAQKVAAKVVRLNKKKAHARLAAMTGKGKTNLKSIRVILVNVVK
jgi:hypothetical protein